MTAQRGPSGFNGLSIHSPVDVRPSGDDGDPWISTMVRSWRHAAGGRVAWGFSILWSVHPFETMDFQFCHEGKTWRRRSYHQLSTDARTDLKVSTPEQELRYLWKSKVVPLCNEIRHGLTVSEGKFFMRVFRACDEMVETICEWREQQDARKSDPEV